MTDYAIFDTDDNQTGYLRVPFVSFSQIQSDAQTAKNTNTTILLEIDELHTKVDSIQSDISSIIADLTETVDAQERIKLLDALWFQVKGMTEATQQLNNILAHLLAGSPMMSVYSELGVGQPANTGNLYQPNESKRSLNTMFDDIETAVTEGAEEQNQASLDKADEIADFFIRVLAGVRNSDELWKLDSANTTNRGSLLNLLKPSIYRELVDLNAKWGSDGNRSFVEDGGEVARAIKELGVRFDYDGVRAQALLDSVIQTGEASTEFDVDDNLKAARDKAIADTAYQINAKDDNVSNDAPPGYFEDPPE